MLFQLPIKIKQQRRVWPPLADCCGARSGGISFCRDASAERCSWLECARVQLPSRPVLPVLLSLQILLPSPPLPYRCPPLTTTSVVAAGGEPGRSWTAARRPHRGPRPGGDPVREAAPEAGPGSPVPRPARPNPQCAVRWGWHWGQGGRDSGRLSTDGTGCVVSGRRFVGVVVWCV